jgi:hypothetical protein
MAALTTNRGSRASRSHLRHDGPPMASKWDGGETCSAVVVALHSSLQLKLVLIYWHRLIILPASGRFCFDEVVTPGVGIDLLAQINYFYQRLADFASMRWLQLELVLIPLLQQSWAHFRSWATPAAVLVGIPSSPRAGSQEWNSLLATFSLLGHSWATPGLAPAAVLALLGTGCTVLKTVVSCKSGKRPFLVHSISSV